MVVAEDPGGRGADRVRRFLGGVDEIFQRLVGAVGAHPDNARVEHLVDDRHERIDPEDRLALGIEDHGVGGRKVDIADVVAVGFLPRHVGPANLAASAALVQNHHGLAQNLFGNGCHDAGAHIGAATRRKGDHQLYRPAGELVGMGEAACRD